MGKKNLKDKTALKREIVTMERKKSKKTTVLGLGVAALAVALAGFFIFAGGTGGFQAVTAEAGVVRIPVGEVGDGKAHFYTYGVVDRAVNFFVLRSADGVVRAAFDACDVCFREKKGYRQEGDLMVCNNCGQQFPSVRINEVKGGCNPAPLARGVSGEHLVINEADIVEGGRYF